MRHPRRKNLRRDQFFFGPDRRDRIKAVGERLAEHHDVRNDAKMFDGPQLPAPVKPHLDFIVDQKDMIAIQDLLQLGKIVKWRNDVASGRLDWLHKERPKFAMVGFGVNKRIIFRLKQFLKLPQAGEIAGLFFLPR